MSGIGGLFSYEGGCPEALATYSAVAGLWSCCYSLGEVLGPAMGGALTQRYGFPLCATLCATACFTMAVVTLTFFSLRESSKWEQLSVDSVSHSIPYTDTTWNSANFCRTRSAPESRIENSPLLTPCSCNMKNGYSYGTSPAQRLCLHSKRSKGGSASVAEALAYFLKFQYLTNFYIRIRKSKKTSKHTTSCTNNSLYQNYLDNDQKKNESSEIVNNNNITKYRSSEDNYCAYLDNAIFGSPVVIENLNTEHLTVKRNNKGLVPVLLACDEEKKTSGEIIRHNLQKVQFFEQNQTCTTTMENIFDGCECREGVTYVRGTVTVSSTGACEV